MVNKVVYISSYRSAATSEIVKHFWATVRSAIASVGLYFLPLPSTTRHKKTTWCAQKLNIVQSTKQTSAERTETQNAREFEKKFELAKP